MEAESSSKKTVSQQKMETIVKHSKGTDEEVIRIKSSTLTLMAGKNENQTVGLVVGQGDFSFHIVRQTRSPILITFCTVDDLNWPLTKDSPVVRVGYRSFAFAMPGLLYGLQFSSSCPRKVIDILGGIFMRYGHYQDPSRLPTGYMFSESESDPAFWTLSQSDIERFIDPFETQLGAIMTSPTDIDETDEKISRVRRMSAITKVVTNGILVGGIDPTKHIDIFEKRTSSKNERDFESRASATIFIFWDILEAIEVLRMIESGDLITLSPYKPTWTRIPNITFWNINKNGLILILEVVIATTASINGEATAASIEKNEDVHKIDEAMDEDLPKIAEENEEMAKIGQEVVPRVEEDTKVHEDENKKVVAPIREIRFPIIK